jgi:hypothetical protein
MRALVILAPALLLGACQVTDDKANKQVTVGYNEDVAKNAGATALNSVNEAGQAIANDAKKAGAAIGNVDVDVKVGNKTADENKAATSKSH